MKAAQNFQGLANYIFHRKYAFRIFYMNALQDALKNRKLRINKVEAWFHFVVFINY